VLSAEERVILLLRTFYEAREYWDGRAAGEGVKLMPSVWHEGSYPELEDRLIELRDGRGRALWFHATRRYRDGEWVTLRVPVARTLRGPVLQLPPHCELAVGAADISEREVTVKCYRWRSDVKQATADLGIDTLVKRMYKGRRDRIIVPDAFFRRALGLPPREEIAC
jgi:hypothetical protein